MVLEKIPTFSEVQNWAQNQGWITASEAPVQSVEGQTGDVTGIVVTDYSQLENQPALTQASNPEFYDLTANVENGYREVLNGSNSNERVDSTISFPFETGDVEKYPVDEVSLSITHGLDNPYNTNLYLDVDVVIGGPSVITDNFTVAERSITINNKTVGQNYHWKTTKNLSANFNKDLYTGLFDSDLTISGTRTSSGSRDSYVNVTVSAHINGLDRHYHVTELTTL